MAVPSVPLEPFPGLRPFEEDDREVFFGREEVTQEIVERLMRVRFAAVVGAAGVGKSSVVRAGVIPHFRMAMRQCSVAVSRPGVQPLSGLATALADIGVENASSALGTDSRGLIQATAQVSGSVLVVVDQFEEIFRRDATEDPDEPPAFVSQLLEAATEHSARVFVLISLRSDFLGECERFRGLPEAVNRGLYLVPRMTRTRLRDAIEGPAGVAGMLMTPRLVQAVLNDAAAEEYSLGLVQHALRQTWLHRARWGSPLPVDVDDYEAIGRLSSLGRSADEVLARLNYEDRRLAETVLVAMAERIAHGFFVRRPRRLADLAQIAGTDMRTVDGVLEHFAGSGEQLLTRSPEAGQDSLIDLASDLLLTRWHAFRGWLEVESESRERYARLAVSAKLHAEGRAELLRGRDLAEASDLRERWSPAWAGSSEAEFAEVMNYLALSVKNDTTRREDAERRFQQETALRDRDRQLLLVIAVLTVVILVMVFVLRG
jgi:hypothetical protein